MTLTAWVEERRRRIDAENRDYVTEGIPPDEADACFAYWRRTTLMGQGSNAAYHAELVGAALLDALLDALAGALRKIGLLLRRES